LRKGSEHSGSIKARIFIDFKLSRRSLLRGVKLNDYCCDNDIKETKIGWICSSDGETRVVYIILLGKFLEKLIVERPRRK
jgi:hypothetical protein